MPVANASIADVLMQLLGGAPAAAQTSSATPRPVQGPPMPQIRLPMNGPIPPQRPMAELPGGSFSPAAMPQDEPAVPVAPQPVMPQPVAAQAATDPLSQLFGGRDLRSMARAFGAGAANIRTGGGDPFVAFGSGFGGASGYYDSKEAAEAKAAADAEKVNYDRSQDALKIKRADDKDAQEMELRRTSEKRLNRSAELSNQKTAMEIKNLAKSNGITVSQQLEIERIAQAAAENVYSPEERRKIMDETRDRLTKQVTSGDTTSLSGGGGLSAPAAGTVEDGYRFNGGDPADPNNWTLEK